MRTSSPERASARYFKELERRGLTGEALLAAARLARPFASLARAGRSALLLVDRRDAEFVRLRWIAWRV